MALPTVRNESKYEHFVRCCEFLKIPNITRSLDEMLTLDFIIYDTPSVYIDPALNVESQPFASFHDEQIRLVSNPQAFDLSRLAGIEKMPKYSTTREPSHILIKQDRKKLSKL